MTTAHLTIPEQLKFSALGRGMQIDDSAAFRLSDGGRLPLTIREYATTGGITMAVGDDIYVNVPFDEWYCEDPEITLSTLEGDGGYVALFRGHAIPVRVLPLPGFLDAADDDGNLVRDSVMSHADRMRLSPVSGCSFSCRFCDYWRQEYTVRPLEQLLAAMEMARQDTVLPVKHVLVSGGTPRPADRGFLGEVCQAVIEQGGLPVDIMMAPWADMEFMDRLAEWGVHGYALNIELYDEEVARRLVPQKHQLGLERYAQAIERALANTGGEGRVRSLILVGLEPEEKTLAGVEFLARLGCDPVLSPFRPAAGTELADIRPPSPESLTRVYLAAEEIAARHGVKLGPRCIPCQHNTLTLPDSSGAYYAS